MSVDLSSRIAHLDATVDEVLRRLERFERVCDACRGNVNGKLVHADEVQRSSTREIYDKLDALKDDLGALKVRVAFYSGGAALLGAMAGPLIAWVLGKL